MDMKEEKSDKHFSLWMNDNLLRRLFRNQKKYCFYITNGQYVADLGCGPGFFTLALAECVGTEGRVYAVDMDNKAIQALEKKVDKRGYNNIEAHVSSAHDLSFIKDESVDFILADGLLCSMAPQQHEVGVKEMKRILKPDGLIYLKVARGPWSYMTKTGWDQILEGFKVEQRNDGFPVGHRWALVSKKHD